MRFDEPFGGVIPGARGAVLAALLRTGSRMTGRQVHGLLSDDHSLWSVQRALKVLSELGIVSTESVGRAQVHGINEGHYAVGPLRSLLSPVTALTETLRELDDDRVTAVILFGSVGRGEPRAASDVDLAVVAAEGWDDRARIQDCVRTRLGNDCDVLVFTVSEFIRRAVEGEPVVADILDEGVALVGAIPKVGHGAA